MCVIWRSIFAGAWCKKSVPETFHSRVRNWFDARRRMPEVVRQHAADFADGHPDANLLSAFAENALIQREREAVAAHLAWCADCRECLATALTPVAAASEPVRGRLAPRLWWSVAVTAAACCVLSIEWFVRQPVRQAA